MKEQVSEIFSDLKTQVTEYLNNPGVTEQYTAREITSVVSDKAFEYFERNFPDRAAKIKASFKGKDLQSRALMFAISLIFKNKKVKAMTPPMVATLISDVMSEITRWVGSGTADSDSSSPYPGLETKLMQVSPDSLENYINWQDSLSAEDLGSVCSFLSTKSVEEIDALLQLELEKRNKVMSAFLRLRQRPVGAAASTSKSDQPESSFLLALRKLKGGLQITHDQMVKNNPDSKQEGS